VQKRPVLLGRNVFLRVGAAAIVLQIWIYTDTAVKLVYGTYPKLWIFGILAVY